MNWALIAAVAIFIFILGFVLPILLRMAPAILQIIPALATAILAYLTYLYLSETRKMSSDMKEQTEIMREQYLSMIQPSIQLTSYHTPKKGSRGVIELYDICITMKNRKDSFAELISGTLTWWTEDNPDNPEQEVMTIPKGKHLHSRGQTDSLNVPLSLPGRGKEPPFTLHLRIELEFEGHSGTRKVESCNYHIEQ